MVRPRVAARCEHVNDAHKRFLYIGFGPPFRLLNTDTAEQACGNAPGRAVRPGREHCGAIPSCGCRALLSDD
jgi:hypothetical protein